MYEAGIGYGSINYPVDRDPICGYTGVIDIQCPKCGKEESKDGKSFERIRRIIGYLLGNIFRWNDAKKAEEKQRKNKGKTKEKQRKNKEKTKSKAPYLRR